MLGSLRLIPTGESQRPSHGTPQEVATPAQLTFKQWLALANDRPDEVPHVGIEGATGTTKTTLAEAIVATRTVGQFVIITAKPDEHEWCSLPFTTIDDDGEFSEAEQQFKHIKAEIQRRLVCAKRRQTVGPYLTVVLDDFTRLRAKCPSAAEVIELIGDQGRSIRVRLILITRSKLVEALGIKGQGDWRGNLVFVTLDRTRKARMEWDGISYLIDTQPAYQLSRQQLSPSRAWVVPQPMEQETILSSLFADEAAVPVPSAHRTLSPDTSSTTRTGTAGIAHIDAVPPNDEDSERTEGVPAVLTDEAIRILYNTWGSKNKVAALLTGTKKKRLEIIDRAVADIEEVTSAQ